MCAVQAPPPPHLSTEQKGVLLLTDVWREATPGAGKQQLD